MKLRIKGNSIRLRLGRSEVARVVAGDVVEESTTFDPSGRQRLVYRLQTSPAIAAPAASFDGSCLVVQVPADLATAWGTTDRVGIAADQPGPDGGRLRILIEKDLECLDVPPEESQADAFARPDGQACPPATSLRN